MLCAYLDETGNTGSDLENADQPIHTVGALLVPESAWTASKRDMASVLASASQRIYAVAERNDVERHTLLELHGKEILQGVGAWRLLSITDRLVILDECLQVAERHSLRIVAGQCNKSLLAKRYLRPEHPHSIALWLCLERIARYAAQYDQLAMMIADSCSRDHTLLSLDTLKRYRESGPPFGATVDFSVLIDTLHFMTSHDSMHLQLCDVILYIQNRFKLKSDKRLEDFYYRCNRLFAAPPGVIPY